MSEQMPQRGVPLELGGKTLYLRYSLSVRRKLMADFGGEDKFNRLRGDQIAQVILAGVKASAPDITTEWLEEEIDMQNIGMVTEKMSEAMGQKKATVEVAEEGEVQPAS